MSVIDTRFAMWSHHLCHVMLGIQHCLQSGESIQVMRLNYEVTTSSLITLLVRTLLKSCLINSWLVSARVQCTRCVEMANTEYKTRRIHGWYRDGIKYRRYRLPLRHRIRKYTLHPLRGMCLSRWFLHSLAARRRPLNFSPHQPYT